MTAKYVSANILKSNEVTECWLILDQLRRPRVRSEFGGKPHPRSERQRGAGHSLDSASVLFVPVGGLGLQSVVPGDLEGKVCRCLFVRTPHIVMTKISLKSPSEHVYTVYNTGPFPPQCSLCSMMSPIQSSLSPLPVWISLLIPKSYIGSKFGVGSPLCVEIAAGLLSRGGKMESSETIYNS